MNDACRFWRGRRKALVLCTVAGLFIAADAGAQSGPPGEAPPGAPPSGSVAEGTPASFAPGSVMYIPPPSPDAPKPTKNPRDFAGVYIGRPEGDPLANPNGRYAPKGAARVARRRPILASDMGLLQPPGTCRPYDAILNPSQPVFPVTIVQNDKRVVLVEEEGRTIWEIFLDRGHPANLMPSYNGNSVGHWEGDTLVVDAIGWNGKSWLDLIAGPNSEKTHVTARIVKNVENGEIEFSVRIEDPELYTGPRDERYALVWRPEVKMHEFDCESGQGIGSNPGIVEDTDEHPYVWPEGQAPATARPPAGFSPPAGGTPPPGFSPPTSASAPAPQ